MQTESEPIRLGVVLGGLGVGGGGDVGGVAVVVSEGSTTVTITIYFINPSGKLKLSFNRTTKNLSQ